MKGRKVLLTAIIVFFLILSFVLFALPFVDNQVYQLEQDKIILHYNDTITSRNNESVDKNKTHKKAASIVDLKGLKSSIIQYNKKIYREHQSNFSGTLSNQSSPLNLSSFGFDNEMYGYLSIDKIGLKMAIYLGATDFNMSIGAACLAETSIPFGGKNTNAVIAGHCGYGGRHYFRYIGELEKGDVIKVHIPFGELNYKVVRKEIINPGDSEKVLIEKGKDMVTLFTCYPYPMSTYRMCVFCERCPSEGQ